MMVNWKRKDSRSSFSRIANKRARELIYIDILKVISRGIDKPTQIMYKANLSWENMQNIFETLIESGFIKEELKNNSKRYELTDKGRSALSYYMKSLDGLVEVKQIISR